MGGCQCSNANPENNIDVPNKEVNEEDKFSEFYYRTSLFQS